MTLITPNKTVNPKPYDTRFVGSTVAAITVWTPEGFITVNNPRTIYWKRDEYGYAMTIRAQDSRETLRCDSNEYGIVAVYYQDGRIETDEYHVDSLD